MKSVLVIFVVGAVSALANNYDIDYDFEEPDWEKLPEYYRTSQPYVLDASEKSFDSPRIPWDLPSSSWNSPEEDFYQYQSGSSENKELPRIPLDFLPWGGPEFQIPQIFLGPRGQSRMNWPGSFISAFQKNAKYSPFNQERVKKIMAELEEVAEKVYETFEVLKIAAQENSQEEISNIVSEALEETLTDMNDAKDYALEMSGDKYKKCINDMDDELERIVKETKEIPMPECSPSNSNELIDSFEEKINEFNRTMTKINEMNENINYNIKNCPFRNPKLCHKGLLSLENSARHTVREAYHQIQEMEKAMDMEGAETDECRNNYLENLIAQGNEYNEILELCSKGNTYEEEEEEEEEDYNLENLKEDQYNEETNEEETEDEEDISEITPQNDDENDDKNDEEISQDKESNEGITSKIETEEKNSEKKVEEERENTTLLEQS